MKLLRDVLKGFVARVFMSLYTAPTFQSKQGVKIVLYMKLEEIFEKYPDEITGFYRLLTIEEFKIHRPDLNEKQIIEAVPKYSVRWLKGLKGWGNQESRNMGFWIPQHMIRAAIADDWVLYVQQGST